NRGISFLGYLPQNAGRIVDYSSALESLEKEMQEFPDNTEASIGLNSLKYDLKKIPKEDFEVKMKLAMRDFKSVESENGVQTISKVYRMMGKSEEAKALEQKYIDRQPYSHIAEEAVLAKLAGAGSLTEFSEIAEEYFNKFPDSQKRDKIFSALVTAYLQVSDYNGLQSALSRIQGVSPIVYSQLALDLLNNEKLLPRNSEKEKYEMASEIYYKKLRFYITDSTSTFNMKKPEFFSSIEWTADRRYYRGSLAEVASEIYAKKGTIDTAIQMGKLALKLQGDDASPNLYQKLIELLSTSDSTEAAYNTAVNAILASKTNEDIYSYHRSLYESLNPDFADSYTALIDSLENIAKVKRLALLKYEELNIPKANAYLQDPVGFMLDLNDIKGHVGVLYFWSSWCGVCGEVFPPLNYLYEKYQDSAFCKIVYVNVWENPKDNRDNTIKEYFKDTDYNFKVYYEETDALPQKYGITGLPVTVILDKKGMAQFIIKGFTNEGDYVRSVEDRIEFLSNQ
ncbi:MAG: hypothetical protein QG635_2453, partial [Bacteroidota bacterium]|nr:hypothetical protein [Bacteroidota bacterium]